MASMMVNIIPRLRSHILAQYPAKRFDRPKIAFIFNFNHGTKDRIISGNDPLDELALHNLQTLAYPLAQRD